MTNIPAKKHPCKKLLLNSRTFSIFAKVLQLLSLVVLMPKKKTSVGVSQADKFKGHKCKISFKI